jgi:hypothetical protein
MANIYNGSICLSDIPTEKITVSNKNGKEYVNFVLWINHAPDQFNKIGSIHIKQNADEITNKNKKTFIGNLI